MVKKYNYVKKRKRKNGHRWEVRIRIDGRQQYVGVFDDEVEAAEAADHHLLTVLGAEDVLAQRRPLNFPHKYRVVQNDLGVPVLEKK